MESTPAADPGILPTAATPGTSSLLDTFKEQDRFLPIANIGAFRVLWFAVVCGAPGVVRVGDHPGSRVTCAFRSAHHEREPSDEREDLQGRQGDRPGMRERVYLIRDVRGVRQMRGCVLVDVWWRFGGRAS